MSNLTKRSAWFIPTLVILFQLSTYTTEASMLSLKQCKGVDLDGAEKHMMTVTDCLKDMGVNDLKDLPTEKMACFGKCAMKKRGLIDDKGLPHKENIMKSVTDQMPDIVHAELNKLMEACLKDETDMIDPADATCTTYIPLAMCMHTAFIDVCDA